MKKNKIIDLIFQNNEHTSANNKLKIIEVSGSSKIDISKIIKKTTSLEISSQLSFEDLLKNEFDSDMNILEVLENDDMSSLKNITIEETVIPHASSISSQISDTDFKRYTNRDITLYVEDAIGMKDLQKTQ